MNNKKLLCNRKQMVKNIYICFTLISIIINLLVKSDDSLSIEQEDELFGSGLGQKLSYVRLILIFS